MGHLDDGIALHITRLQEARVNECLDDLDLIAGQSRHPHAPTNKFATSFDADQLQEGGEHLRAVESLFQPSEDSVRLAAERADDPADALVVSHGDLPLDPGALIQLQ